MPLPDQIVIYSTILGSVTIFVAISNALYFHLRYQKALDQAVMGERYYDAGVLLGLNRLMMYGHYCLFPKRAKKDCVYEIFAYLDKVQRVHLILHWAAILATVLIWSSGYIYAEWHGLLD